MSDAPQPPVPPNHQPDPAAPAAPTPPAPHLAAEPQYPAEPQHPAAGQHPAPPAPPAYPTAAPQAYPTAPQAYPTAAPQAYPASTQGYPVAQPGYPAYAAPARTGGNGLGRAAFLIAVITFGINLLTTLARPFLYFSGGDYGYGYGVGSFLDGAVAVLSFLAYGFALVLGIIAARRAAPHLFAGIAIGISGVGVLGVLFTWISTFFYRFI